MKHKLIDNKEEYQASLLNIPENEYILKMKEYAKQNDVPIIQDEGLAFLLMLIGVKKAERLLEIGSAIGYSSIQMAYNNLDLIIDTLEIDPNSCSIAIDNIKNMGLSERINIFNVDALLGFDVVKDNQYDMIFIDAAKGQYINFFKIYEPLLKKGGLIVADNLYFHNLLFEDIESRNLFGLVKRVGRFNQFVKENEQYRYHIFKIGDGIGVFIKEE